LAGAPWGAAAPAGVETARKNTPITKKTSKNPEIDFILPMPIPPFFGSIGMSVVNSYDFTEYFAD